MKRLVAICICVCMTQQAVFGGLSYVTVGGAPVVHDNVNNLYWYPNVGEFVLMNYAEQVSAIDQLNVTPYAGQTGWHMATGPEMDSLIPQLLSEPPNATWFPPTGSGGGGVSLYGRYDELVSPGVRYLNWLYGTSHYTGHALYPAADAYAHPEAGAWAVTSAGSGTPPTVPVPGACGLALIGLAAIRSARRRTRLG